MATKKTTPAPAAETAVAVVKKTGTNIVSIKEQLAAQVAANASRVAPATGNQIRLSGKKFALPDGSATTDPIRVVIVDFVSENRFYESAYDKDSVEPPACFSIDPLPNKMVPSANSPVKQAESCGECPMNQFGSKGKGKACGNTRVLAVLPEDADADTPIWIIKVSPTGLKAFDGYVQSVARTFQAPPVAVVTEISFDDSKDYPSLVFGAPLPNSNLEVHFARQGEARELLMAEPDVSGYQAPAPVPARGAARPVARPTARQPATARR